MWEIQNQLIVSIKEINNIINDYEYFKNHEVWFYPSYQ